MKRPKPPLPRSIRIAMSAGQFRQQRYDNMREARQYAGRDPMANVLVHVRDARACNWTMIKCMRSARKAHAKELREAAATNGKRTPRGSV